MHLLFPMKMYNIYSKLTVHPFMQHYTCILLSRDIKEQTLPSTLYSPLSLSLLLLVSSLGWSLCSGSRSLIGSVAFRSLPLLAALHLITLSRACQDCFTLISTQPTPIHSHIYLYRCYIINYS